MKNKEQTIIKTSGCKTIVIISLLLQYCTLVKSNSDSNLCHSDDSDPGNPLYLTPYIENGQIESARNSAKVQLTEELNITSYAGFFTVNKTYNVNYFIWYFPPTIEKDGPILLYLNGGPGSSGLGGLFNQVGPLKVIGDKLAKRDIHWTLENHVIFIDNPVGTGFSFTDDARAYCTDNIQVADYLHNTIQQFLELFPDLQPKEFFIFGLSYAGKFAPALGYTIHKNNPSAKIRINFKGIVIGNGFIDPVTQATAYDSQLYQLGLVDWNGAAEIRKAQDYIVECINNHHWIKATDAINELIHGFGLNETILSRLTGFNFFMNILFERNYMSNDYKSFIEKPSVRKQIHVGNLPFSKGFHVVEYLREDIMQSAALWLSEVLEHYPVLLYSGQLDILTSYQSTIKFLQEFKFSDADQYKTAKRQIWMSDGEVAGYIRKAGRLVEILVRNAGHIVAVDQPKVAYDIITMFINETRFT